MMVKYSEVLLAIKYRERDAKGDWVGGPMYYVKNGLGKGWQWVGILFCIFAAIAAFGIGNMSQVNSIVGSINNAVDAFIPAAAAERGMLNLILGIVLAALVGIILFGGIKRIGAVAEKLVPAMSASLHRLWRLPLSLSMQIISSPRSARSSPPLSTRRPSAARLPVLS